MKRSITAAMLGVTALLSPVGTGIPTAAAQVNGDEKCSPDGHVMTYNSVLNTWFKQLATCSNNAGASNQRQSNGGSYSNNVSNGNNGQPENGDQKCSAGHILEYHRYQTLPSGWRDTYRPC